MKCNCCKKNEANVFYSETVNGKKAEAYLCNECAEKLGVKVRIPELSGFFGKSFFSPFEAFERSFFDDAFSLMNSFDKSFFSERAFTPLFITDSEKKDSKAEKTEKKEEKVLPKNELQILKKQLKRAISEERYEDAAVIRDKIKAFSEKSA